MEGCKGMEEFELPDADEVVKATMLKPMSGEGMTLGGMGLDN